MLSPFSKAIFDNDVAAVQAHLVNNSFRLAVYAHITLYGYSCLEFAAKENYHEMVILLLNYMPDMIDTNKGGNPLYLALKNGCYLTANILLICGADKSKALLSAEQKEDHKTYKLISDLEISRLVVRDILLWFSKYPKTNYAKLFEKLQIHFDKLSSDERSAIAEVLIKFEVLLSLNQIQTLGGVANEKRLSLGFWLMSKRAGIQSILQGRDLAIFFSEYNSFQYNHKELAYIQLRHFGSQEARDFYQHNIENISHSLNESLDPACELTGDALELYQKMIHCKLPNFDKGMKYLPEDYLSCKDAAVLAYSNNNFLAIINLINMLDSLDHYVLAGIFIKFSHFELFNLWIVYSGVKLDRLAVKYGYTNPYILRFLKCNKDYYPVAYKIIWRGANPAANVYQEQLNVLSYLISSEEEFNEMLKYALATYRIKDAITVRNISERFLKDNLKMREEFLPEDICRSLIPFLTPQDIQSFSKVSVFFKEMAGVHMSVATKLMPYVWDSKIMDKFHSPAQRYVSVIWFVNNFMNFLLRVLAAVIIKGLVSFVFLGVASLNASFSGALFNFAYDFVRYYVLYRLGRWLGSSLYFDNPNFINFVTPSHAFFLKPVTQKLEDRFAYKLNNPFENIFSIPLKQVITEVKKIRNIYVKEVLDQVALYRKAAYIFDSEELAPKESFFRAQSPGLRFFSPSNLSQLIVDVASEEKELSTKNYLRA